ncbi:glycosyltransferase family 4 protein [Niastella yeongjuensis]|nr:glycosyltransferase family 4 protein [Niastella yeongjuensis]
MHEISDSARLIDTLSSIEYYLLDFKGKIIITTNQPVSHLKKIEAYLSTSTAPVSIIEVQENATVAEVRNFLANTLNYNWLLFMEPGMSFIKNPLVAIKSTIADLGVNFINLPLISSDHRTVYSLGGTLLTDENNRYVGGGNCFDFKPGFEYTDYKIKNPFLSDNLASNACVINRKNFLHEGGFTSNTTPGLEDVAFSLHLYEKSVKIGNINEFVLINNSPLTENQNQANGLGVLNPNDDQSKDLKIIDGAVIKNKLKTKKRIALLVDIKDWAFDNIAKNIEHNLSKKYDFTIYYLADFAGERWLELFVVLYKEKHDMIMFFWRLVTKQIFSEANKQYIQDHFNISKETYERYLNNTIILTGVYDHLFLTPDGINNSLDIFSNHVDGYFVASNKLKHIYDHIPGFMKPHSVIQDGVDTDKFHRIPGATFSDASAPLVVGWAGNSKWGMDVDGIDHKGFETIINPAISELIEEGYKIKLIYADRHEPSTHIPRSEMNNFYNKLDVYICTSDIEGTPNPVLESMACGIGIVSTDVGIVKEVLGKEQQKFILEERTKECLKKKLITLINDRSILHILAAENKIRINNWTWKSKCEKFETFFDYYFFKRDSQRFRIKRFPFPTAKPKVTHEENEPVNILFRLNLDIMQELGHWKELQTETKNWYYNEYEILPLWYKRLGHIIKVLTGKRSIKSLFKK